MLNAREETFKALNRLKEGARFTSDVFAERMNTRLGKKHHVDTYLRYLRAYRTITGRKVINIDKPKSLYEVMKGECL